MAITVGDSSAYSNYYSAVQSSATSALENTLNSDSMKSATDEELMDACKQFEAYFVEQMYKAMEKTVVKDDEEENEYESYFGDMQIQEYASMATEGEGIGIAKMLFEQMQRNYSVPDTSGADNKDTATDTAADTGVEATAQV